MVKVKNFLLLFLYFLIGLVNENIKGFIGDIYCNVIL